MRDKNIQARLDQWKEKLDLWGAPTLFRRFAGWPLETQKAVMRNRATVLNKIKKKGGEAAVAADRDLAELVCLAWAIRDLDRVMTDTQAALAGKETQANAVAVRLDRLRGDRAKAQRRDSVIGRQLMANIEVIEQLRAEGASLTQISEYLAKYHRIKGENGGLISKSYVGKFIQKHCRKEDGSGDGLGDRKPEAHNPA